MINGDQLEKCGEQRSRCEMCANAINVEVNRSFSSYESESELKIGNSGDDRRASKEWGNCNSVAPMLGCSCEELCDATRVELTAFTASARRRNKEMRK